jgi:ankyrin repeat protein
VAFLTKKLIITDLLLENFNEINKTMKYEECNSDEPLLFFAFYCHEYTKTLLEKGADIDCEDMFRETMLFRAVRYDNRAVVEFLIKKRSRQAI